MQALARERAYLAASGYLGAPPPADFLAISGGGEDGAFGAGRLVGWTAASTRPTFLGIIGISTGALTAPFAFLGPSYNSKLREIYTSASRKDVLESNGHHLLLREPRFTHSCLLSKGRSLKLSALRKVRGRSTDGTRSLCLGLGRNRSERRLCCHEQSCVAAAVGGASREQHGKPPV
jgi:hypothetical protein